MVDVHGGIQECIVIYRDDCFVMCGSQYEMMWCDEDTSKSSGSCKTLVEDQLFRERTEQSV